MKKLKSAPTQRALSIGQHSFKGDAICATSVGYIQFIDVEKIQQWAEKNSARIRIHCLPGKFVSINEPLAYLQFDQTQNAEINYQIIVDAFHIGRERLYDFDPRFGLVALSEIASRALSPAVNDPGTYINILSVLTRLLNYWVEPIDDKDLESVIYNRVEMPEISISNMFDDAFTGIARDGVGLVEVGVMLQKCLSSLAKCNHNQIQEVASLHRNTALNRAKQTISLKADFEKIKDSANIQ